MSKPVAVLISDIHYNINTLEVADKAMRMAIDKANELSVHLVVAGDLHDTKANLRGECINALMQTFNTCEYRPYIIIGNHCRLNEKSPLHALNFLGPIACIVDKPMFSTIVNSYMIPYNHNPDELRTYLKTIPSGSRLIMHQGLTGSNRGDYIQDHSALNHEDVADFRVISGHYHQRQDIKTGRPRKGAVGLWSYIGNPYTLNFGEADDPGKGFLVLMDDGTTEFIPTNLRRHRILDITWQDGRTYSIQINKSDILLVKVRNSPSDLSKTMVASKLGIKQSFRLDIVPSETTIDSSKIDENRRQPEILDSLIDSLSNTDLGRKERLKKTWKTFANREV